VPSNDWTFHTSDPRCSRVVRKEDGKMQLSSCCCMRSRRS
jgi:hypothetical protein